MSSQSPQVSGGRNYDAVEYSTTDGLRWCRFIILSFQSLYNILRHQKLRSSYDFLLNLSVIY